jgi:hypothetical protein
MDNGAAGAVLGCVPMRCGLRAAAVVLTLVGSLAVTTASSEELESDPGSSAPVVEEHRYKMSAAIRPLLFWIGDKDVGGARIAWLRDAGGRRGYEFLLGSDPDRAPRRINRWGFVREEVGLSGATQMGLMRRTDEETVEEAHAQVGYEGDYVFKAIRTNVADGKARAENTVWRVERDFTYYDLPELLRLVEGRPQAAPKVNEATLPPGTEPGFLFAVADLVDRAVAAASRTPRQLLSGVATRFNFNAVAYDLKLRTTEWMEAKEYGGRRYERLVRIDFESYNPKLRTTERFTLVCGTEGELARVPVYVKYQPKWWFKAEGVLDETQSFERPGDRPRPVAESSLR